MSTNYGTAGKKHADNEHAYWARVRSTDLKYSQDSCGKVFQKSSSLGATIAERCIHVLCKQLADDPDEVLTALGISPEVVFHGGACMV